MSDSLSVAGSVVGIVSLGALHYYNAFANAESDVAQILTKLESLQKLLDSLYRQLKDRKFCLNDRYVLPKDTLAIAKALGRRLAYPFREKTLRRREEDIAELQLNDTGNIRNEVEETKTLMDLVNKKVFEWLKAPDATIDFNEAWPRVQVMARNTGLFLWLSGFAGCGKSVLCSTAIQYAFRHRRSSPRVAIAFFSFLSPMSASRMCRPCCAPWCYSCLANSMAAATMYCDYETPTAILRHQTKS
ncbi:hypothetical protein GCG54_00006108 [Colletotrichum gloeosporioides]|uniref:Nephrocystin 3-like N-terminal domain-containing protein n=1 Tax=Colletotrichum gloeosporioides TaxID=474922 RepID=A0A8H4FLI6_COLGL|nr:uncharacterized protein GCG54_00006108 [Colletotrichum gloeosporioides]KAF3806346.1 hypothetical protein GCG54_00006108 [Colletotrichum gloeosporioides]